MKLKPCNLLTFALALGLATVLEAGTFTDNFNSSHSFKTNGVVDTPWAGVTAGQINPASVATWDANITAPGTLTITNTGGYWADAGDGPYLWTQVKGTNDFAATVHVSSLAQINYNFGGLLIRNPNSVSNWLYLSIFAEYGVEVDWRDTTDGASVEGTSSGSNYVETNSATWRSWLEITRTNGTLTASASADGVNWEVVYQSARTDLTSDLQVGIFNSTFSGNTCSAQFQNFSLTGAGVGGSTPPGAATNLVVNAAVNSLDVSWTAGAGSDGSVVVVRRSQPITRQPLDGNTYAGNAIFGAGTDLGQSNYVVYAGSGTSVTVTNLTPTIPYTVAVYAYSGSGAATVYSLNDTPFATQAPSGNPTGLMISYGSTNAVAVDDSIQATVNLIFDTGGRVDITGTASFSSDKTNIAAPSATGLISGLAEGVASITAIYGALSISSNLTVVKVPVTDDFSAPRNYLVDGLAGTFWSGLLLDTNDLDLASGEIASGPTETLTANAGMTQPGRLSVATHDGGFNVGADSGFFLYRVVSGDFSVAIQITKFDSDNGTNAYHMPGLMVRAPFNLAYTENFLQWIGFNEYGIGNFSRRSISGSYAETYFQNPPAMPFIMIQRQTNTFNFYQKAHALDPWILVGTEDRPEYAGVAMQVGIVDQTFTGNTAASEFDNLVFTLDGGVTNNVHAPAAPNGLKLTNSAPGQVTASWVAGAGSLGSVVIAHPLMGATRQPMSGDDFSATANADFSLGANLGASNVVVYAGSGTSVDVTNLPASWCYFSVYSYANSSGTNFYNQLSPATAAINLGSGSVVLTPISITPGSVKISGTGSSAMVSFSFTNAPGLSFSILATNNLAAPVASWPVIGTAIETPSGSGQYQFSDSSSATNSTRFYLLRQP